MISADDVLEWLVSSTGATVPPTSPEDEALLGRVVGAVIAHIAHTHELPADVEQADDWDQAHIMQAARLWDRRNTPNGIGGFGDFGAVRISRLDPDVAELLAPYRIIAFS